MAGWDSAGRWQQCVREQYLERRRSCAGLNDPRHKVAVAAGLCVKLASQEAPLRQRLADVIRGLQSALVYALSADERDTETRRVRVRVTQLGSISHCKEACRQPLTATLKCRLTSVRLTLLFSVWHESVRTCCSYDALVGVSPRRGIGASTSGP
jgi:hypothetical protein